MMARQVGAEQHEMLLDVDDLLDFLPAMVRLQDEPIADPVCVPVYYVSKLARDHGVTVCQVGEGADELFFGYPRYNYHSTAAAVLSMPRPLRRAAAFAGARMPTRRLRRIADVLRNDEPDRYARFISWWNPAEVEQMTGGRPRMAPFYADALERSAGLSRTARPCLLDLVSYLPEDILTKVDRASMAVSLEVRAPLLDHRVVEFALGLPVSLKRRGRTMKWILRQLLYKRVPRELIDRPKMGFSVPLGDWFRGLTAKKPKQPAARPGASASSTTMTKIPAGGTAPRPGARAAPAPRAAAKRDDGGLVAFRMPFIGDKPVTKQLQILGTMALVFTLIKASSWGWTSGRTLAGFAVAILLIAAFVVIERRHENPLVPLRIFSNRSLAASVCAHASSSTSPATRRRWRATRHTSPTWATG